MGWVALEDAFVRHVYITARRSSFFYSLLGSRGQSAGSTPLEPTGGGEAQQEQLGSAGGWTPDYLISNQEP